MSTWHFCVLEHFEQIFKTIQMRVSAKEMDARSRARDMYFCLVLYDFSYIVSAFLLGTQHILSHKSQFAGVCVCVRANKFDIEYISFALCRIQFMYERRQNHTLTLSLYIYEYMFCRCAFNNIFIQYSSHNSVCQAPAVNIAFLVRIFTFGSPPSMPAATVMFERTWMHRLIKICQMPVFACQRLSPNVRQCERGTKTLKSKRKIMEKMNDFRLSLLNTIKCVMFTFSWCEWGSFVHSAQCRPMEQYICAAEKLC